MRRSVHAFRTDECQQGKVYLPSLTESSHLVRYSFSRLFFKIVRLCPWNGSLSHAAKRLRSASLLRILSRYICPSGQSSRLSISSQCTDRNCFLNPKPELPNSRSCTPMLREKKNRTFAKLYHFLMNKDGTHCECEYESTAIAKRVRVRHNLT